MECITVSLPRKWIFKWAKYPDSIIVDLSVSKGWNDDIKLPLTLSALVSCLHSSPFETTKSNDQWLSVKQVWPASYRVVILCIGVGEKSPNL